MSSFAALKAQSEVIVSHEPHDVRVIDDGNAALQVRLDMVARAQHSIDVEYYIYGLDQAGRMFTQAVVNRIHELKVQGRTLRVRYLIDYYGYGGTPEFDAYHAAELVKEGVEFRYFNRSDLKKFWIVSHRNHRKLLVIDGNEVVTGGRNLSDDYFDLAHSYTFMDRDIWVKGAIARSVDESFTEFFDNKISSPVEAPKSNDDGYSNQVASAKEFLSVTENDRRNRETLEKVARVQLESIPTHRVHSIGFVSDRPGKESQDREMTPFLVASLDQAKSFVEVENYVFMPHGDLAAAFDRLLERKVAFRILTNGYASQDPEDETTTFLSVPHQLKFAKRGLKIDHFQGVALSDQLLSDEKVRESKWGLHTKSWIIDGNKSFIGTPNIDPRSMNLNCEDGIVVYDDSDVAHEIQRSIQRRRESSLRLESTGLYANGHDPTLDLDPDTARELRRKRLFNKLLESEY